MWFASVGDPFSLPNSVDPGVHYSPSRFCGRLNGSDPEFTGGYVGDPRSFDQ